MKQPLSAMQVFAALENFEAIDGINAVKSFGFGAVEVEVYFHGYHSGTITGDYSLDTIIAVKEAVERAVRSENNQTG